MVAMNFHLKFPTLETIAKVKVVSELWTSDEILKLVKICDVRQPPYSETWSTYDIRTLIEVDKIRDESRWKEIEEIVFQHVQNLKLPEKLKSDASRIIEPIGRDLIKWIRAPHVPCKSFRLKRSRINHYLKNLRWSPRGSIDRKAMMILLLEDNEIEMRVKFELACNLCHGEAICQFWKKLRPHKFERLKLPKIRKHEYDMVWFWKFCLEGQLEILDWHIKTEYPTSNPYQLAFKLAREKSNIPAMEYFWGKLSNSEQEYQFDQFTHRAIFFSGMNRTSVLGFIGNHFTPDRRLALFTHQPFQIMMSLLEWPYQELFLEISGKMWDVIQNYDFYYILALLANEAKRNRFEERYLDFFEHIWVESPPKYKEYVLRQELELVYLLRMLHELPTDRYARMILLDLENISDRDLLSFSPEIAVIFKLLIINSNWEMFDLYLRVFITYKGLAAFMYGEMECQFRDWPNTEVKEKWSLIASHKISERFIALEE